MNDENINDNIPSKGDVVDGYGFEIDVDNFTQVGDTRFFEISGSKESIDKFLKDNDLFQEK